MSQKLESPEPPPLGDDRYVEHWSNGDFSLTTNLASYGGVWTARIVMLAFAGAMIRQIHRTTALYGAAYWWDYAGLALAVSGFLVAVWRPARVRSRVVIDKQRTRVSYEPRRGGSRPIDVPTPEVDTFLAKGVSGAHGLYLRTARGDAEITIGLSWTSKPLAERLNFALERVRAAPEPKREPIEPYRD